MTTVKRSYTSVLQIEYGNVDNNKKDVQEKKVFNEFCDTSTIHGLKYLGTRPLHEKLLWMLFFIASLTVCGFQIKATWDKWTNNPVIVTFNENFISIAEIPFPAVTICKQSKAQSSLFDYDAIYSSILHNGTNAMENLPKETLKLFELVAQTCIKDGSRKEMMTLVNRFTEYKKKQWIDNINDLDKIAPDFEESFINCGGMMAPDHWICKEVLSKVFTEEGVCYTFNLLNKDEFIKNGTILNIVDRTEKIKPNWSMEIGTESVEYEYGLTFCRDPLRAYTVGQKLQIKLASKSKDVSEYCQGSGERFKIFLHSPHEIPSSQHQSYDMDISQIVTLSVRPRIVLASNKIQNAYSAERRRCYFNSEKPLRYFRIYSKKNCETECLANITARKCGCTPFWLPRDNCTPICGLSHYNCITRISYYHLNIEIAAASFTQESLKGNTTAEFECNCMAACNTVMYEADVREIKLVENSHSHRINAIKNNRNAKYGNNDTNINTKQYSKLIVQFKEAEFMAMKRSELFGLTDFIANCGGLLGLFMGVSLLSFVEIIYFFTIRTCSAIKCRK